MTQVQTKPPVLENEVEARTREHTREEKLLWKPHARSLLFCAVLLPILVPAAPAFSEEWKIGVLVCLTGECAASGDAALRGATLAANELNECGGVLGKKVVLVVEDTAEATSGAKAVTAYRNLRLSSDIHFFIGPTWTPGGLAIAPVVARDSEIVMTSPSLGVKEFHEAGENLFNTHGAEEVTTRALARLALKNGWKRVAIWSSQQPWESLQATFFEDEIKKGGGEVILELETLPTVRNLEAEALKVAVTRPDVILFSIVNQQAIAARALKRIGYEGPKIAVLVDETRLRESQGTLEGTIFGRIGLPTSDFISKMKSHHPGLKSVEPPAGIAYDTVKMYAQAVIQSDSFEPKRVARAFLEMNYDGASGFIAFDEHGGVRREAEIMQINGGRETKYSE